VLGRFAIAARDFGKQRCAARPDDKLVLLPTMGGQTALNTALTLNRLGILAKWDVEMIGARAPVIDKAEDRELFRDAMKKIGLETPRSMLAHNFVDAMTALETVGLPAIIRPSFTLGGTGGGIAYNREEYFEIVDRGFDASPTREVLVEESAELADAFVQPDQTVPGGDLFPAGHELVDDGKHQRIGFLWGGMTMGMMLSIPLALAGIILIAQAMRRQPQEAQEARAERSPNARRDNAWNAYRHARTGR